MMGVELPLSHWLLACGLGAVVGLDAVSWPQGMWSRPIVAGTLGGLLFGAPAGGFLIGAWLDLVLSRHPSFGGARHPEPGPAAFTAGAAYGLAETGSAVGLLAAVAAGWALGWTGAYSVGLLRRLTARLVSGPGGVRGGAGVLARRHRLAMLLDGVRAGLLVAALLVPSALLVRFLSTQSPGGSGLVWTPALAAVGLAGAAGVAARGLGARSRSWPVFAAGGLLGAILARVLA
ncbi:PTS sugar transporter subunit IIC [Candidatus Palauibacter sp.]|uniref:PTS sugar transporter subunit IIC n=1 Tax=Candidatus Palauibacter sp. TaxID=3101350 RepID=UPI003B5C37B0